MQKSSEKSRKQRHQKHISKIFVYIWGVTGFENLITQPGKTPEPSMLFPSILFGF